MSVSADDVRKVAHLARLEISIEELPEIASELSGILDWVEQLSQVDTTGVEPMASAVDIELRIRDDVPNSATNRKDILTNAPDARGAFFAVPKVIE